MSYRVVLAVVLAVLLTTSASTTASSSDDTRFKLGAATIGNQFNPEDRNPPILGFVTLMDDGKSLRVTGTAINLDPGAAYFSLLYDRGSVPAGKDACEPSKEDQITERQMVVGFWQGTGSTRHIDVTKTKTTIDPVPSGVPPEFLPPGNFYVPISKVATISIRNVSSNFALQACGVIVPGVNGRHD